VIVVSEAIDVLVADGTPVVLWVWFRAIGLRIWLFRHVGRTAHWLIF
jgi:hypothetical protein